MSKESLIFVRMDVFLWTLIYENVCNVEYISVALSVDYEIPHFSNDSG
jgi:hypothetical protein